MTFQKGAGAPIEYPLRNIPRTGSVVNPTRGRNRIGMPKPTPYGQAFDRQMARVERARRNVVAGVWPEWVFTDWGIPSEVAGPLVPHIVPGEPGACERAAELVRMDLPFDLFAAVIRWQNTPLKSKYQRARFGHIDFIGYYLVTFAVLATALARGFRTCFALKWLWGVERFEEWNGQGPSSTAYPEGCPKHPADPAGHGFGAGATFAVLEKRFDYSPDEAAEVFAACAMFAQCRTLAGVHREIENVRGFVGGYAVANRVSFGKAVVMLEKYAPWGLLLSVEGPLQ